MHFKKHIDDLAIKAKRVKIKRCIYAILKYINSTKFCPNNNDDPLSERI
jgi:ribosomal protein S15P/S13E